MRRYAYEIVSAVMEEGEHSDEVFHRITDTHRDFSPQQRRYLKRLSYGTIERCVELDEILGRFSRVRLAEMDVEVRTVLRMALYEIRYMSQVPDAVACYEAVELLKKVGGTHAGFVNGVLRRILREGYEPDPGKPWLALSLPKELYDLFCGQYGKKTAGRIGQAFLEKSGDMALHIVTDRISVREYGALLDEMGVAWRPGFYHEEALILSHVSDVQALPGYEEGWFFIQDESSMLPAKAAGIGPGDVVADVCSAPGGKAIHAMLLQRGRGCVSARDVSEGKRRRMLENFKRMQLKPAECKVWDGTKPDPQWRERADVVLADVPCSGLGLIGRKPEIKYHALERAEDLIPIQRKICEASAAMLKKGGVFLYSTCTIHRRENEENVDWLEENCGLRRESLDPYIPGKLCNRMTCQGMLQMLPGLQESDGFFLARLRKV